MARIEFSLIGKNTNIDQFRNELRWNEMYYR
jgi:L-arabinose isomerase